MLMLAKIRFQKAVIDPYEQGISHDVLLGNESYKLIDKSGKQITPPENIKHAYILCVSNEPYPAVMDQMRAFWWMLISTTNAAKPV